MGDEQPLKDRRLEERAVREGWDVPQDVRTKVLKRLAGVVDPETAEGATAELRYVIQAARTIASADLRQQALDLARDKHEAGTLAATAAATAPASIRLVMPDNGRNRPPGGSPVGVPGE